jgi:hypothetical protein
MRPSPLGQFASYGRLRHVSISGCSGSLWADPTTDPLQHPTQMTHWSTQNQAAPCIGEEEDSNGFASYLRVQCGKCNNTQDRSPTWRAPVDQLSRPVIFHDGCLVRLPMPLAALLSWFSGSSSALRWPASASPPAYAARVLRVLGRSGCCSRAHTACC